jgi:hypothetical protein
VLNADELLAIKNLGLLTLKPLIYAANVSEDDLGNQGANNVHVQALRKRAAEEGAEVVVVSAKVRDCSRREGGEGRGRVGRGAQGSIGVSRPAARWGLRLRPRAVVRLGTACVLGSGAHCR